VLLVQVVVKDSRVPPDKQDHKGLQVHKGLLARLVQLDKQALLVLVEV
jgi:hypothetical protein